MCFICNTSCVPIGAVVVLALAACVDRPGPVAPLDDHARVEPPSSSDILGGDAALDALRSMIARHEATGRLHEIPEAARNVVTRRPRESPVMLMPSRLITVDGEYISGPYVIDGVTYYESGGVLYPSQDIKAIIQDPYTTTELEPFFGRVSAGFTYVGHDATQRTEWRVINPRTGAVIRSFPKQTFGSKGTKFLGLVKTFAGDVTIRDLPACDIELTASTEHEAWYLGRWEPTNEISASTSGAGIKLTRGKTGSRMVSTAATRKYILCPEKPPGDCAATGTDGPENNSDGADYSRSPAASARLDCTSGGTGVTDAQFGCTLCQQWFEVDYYGRIIHEWWECHEITDLAYCEWLMS